MSGAWKRLAPVSASTTPADLPLEPPDKHAGARGPCSCNTPGCLARSRMLQHARPTPHADGADASEPRVVPASQTPATSAEGMPPLVLPPHPYRLDAPSAMLAPGRWPFTLVSVLPTSGAPSSVPAGNWAGAAATVATHGAASTAGMPWNALLTAAATSLVDHRPPLASGFRPPSPATATLPPVPTGPGVVPIEPARAGKRVRHPDPPLDPAQRRRRSGSRLATAEHEPRAVPGQPPSTHDLATGVVWHGDGWLSVRGLFVKKALLGDLGSDSSLPGSDDEPGTVLRSRRPGAGPAGRAPGLGAQSKRHAPRRASSTARRRDAGSDDEGGDGGGGGQEDEAETDTPHPPHSNDERVGVAPPAPAGTPAGSDAPPCDGDDDGAFSHACRWSDCRVLAESAAELHRHVVIHVPRGTNQHAGQVSASSHPDRARFACRWADCGHGLARPFRSRDKLTLHLRIHTGHHPYACAHAGCSATFVRPDSLRNHMRVHTQVRTYRCPAAGCDRAYFHAKSLMKHRRRQHAEAHVTTSSITAQFHRAPVGAGRDDEPVAGPG